MYKDLHTAIRNGQYSLDGVFDSPTDRAPVPKSSVRSNLHAYDSVSHKGHSLYFVESPFYKIKRLVHGSPQLCNAAAGRSECHFQFILDADEDKLLSENKAMKLYLLCGKRGSGPSSTEVPLEYPIPSEIHINTHQYSGQYKGIKGKLGTAKPADLTEFVKATPSRNKIELIYSQTKEAYLAYLYIVEAISPETVLQTISQRPKIHKSATISRIKSQNEDAEEEGIEVSSSIMPLTDPVSRTKMKYPIQSIYCTHTQCFDGMIFLQTQLQMPTWNCPICSKQVQVNDLAISEYFEEVVSSVPEDVDSVIINVDGSWRLEEIKHEEKDSVQAAYGRSGSAQAENVEVISLSSDEESEDEDESETNVPNTTTTSESEPIKELTEKTKELTTGSAGAVESQETTDNLNQEQPAEQTSPENQLASPLDHSNSLDNLIEQMEDVITEELNDESPLENLREARDRLRRSSSNNSENTSPRLIEKVPPLITNENPKSPQAQSPQAPSPPVQNQSPLQAQPNSNEGNGTQTVQGNGTQTVQGNGTQIVQGNGTSVSPNQAPSPISSTTNAFSPNRLKPTQINVIYKNPYRSHRHNLKHRPNHKFNLRHCHLNHKRKYNLSHNLNLKRKFKCNNHSHKRNHKRNFNHHYNYMFKYKKNLKLWSRKLQP
ncbi:E3 SUMO-protein ligase SIZ1 [Spathaspora sp. JA1]|nr:E3 SUMO-protein ligase SIZ1 [Spathaspora sp. JA1]